MTALAPSSDSRRRAVVLGICCLSVFVTGVDITIVNVALPSIGRDLGASVSGLQWTIDAYTLVIACLLMLSGSLADRFGRRRVFQVGLVTFDRLAAVQRVGLAGHARCVPRVAGGRR